MALFFPIDETAAPYALQVLRGTWYTYHASGWVVIIPGPLGDVIIVYGTTLHRAAGSEHATKRTLFLPLVHKGFRVPITHVEPDKSPF